VARVKRTIKVVFFKFWMVTYGGAFHVENVLPLGIYLYYMYVLSYGKVSFNGLMRVAFRVQMR
jgi:hypothetical protein